MASSVLAALITAVVSLALAIGKIVWDLREKVRERRLAAREQLDRYRAPLLAAVDDLGRRINNIRNDGFLAYLATDARGEMARLSTLFRFAQYFAWTEIVYGFADRLRFETDEATKTVVQTMGDIGWTLASDSLDRVDPDDFTTSRWMLWREEQRAIGELMRQDGDEVGCISFATFTSIYEERFARWFGHFAADLDDPASTKAGRLAQLQGLAERLIRELDVDRVLVEIDESGNLISPRWARSSALAAPTRHTDPLDRS